MKGRALTAAAGDLALSAREAALLATPRAPKPGCVLSARDDLAATGAWLEEHAGSPHTRAAYQREARRLLLWCVRVAGRPLHDLKREHFLAYRAFLADPSPRRDWCGPRRPAGAADWRPFRGPLTAPSIRQAMVILHSLTSYLVETGYLDANPVSKGPRAVGAGDPRQKGLSRRMQDAVAQTLADLPREQAIERARYERLRVLLALAGGAGLRISEVVGVCRGDLIEQETPGRRSQWLRVRGKGGRVEAVPLSGAVGEAIGRYLRHLGRPCGPEEATTATIVRRLDGGASIRAKTGYLEVKRLFEQAAGRISGDEAVRLKHLGPHALRHTYVTAMLAHGASVPVARRLARHANVATTMLYDFQEHDALVDAVGRHSVAWMFAGESP